MGALGFDVVEGVFPAAAGAYSVYEVMSQQGDIAANKALAAAGAGVGGVAALGAGGRCDVGGVAVNMVVIALPGQCTAEVAADLLAPFRAVLRIDNVRAHARERLVRNGAVFAGDHDIINARSGGEGVILQAQAAAVQRHGFYIYAASQRVLSDAQAFGAAVYAHLAKSRAAAERVAFDKGLGAAVAVVTVEYHGCETRAAGKAARLQSHQSGGKLGVGKGLAA